ncbi:MAG TPA: serine hydrolase domain-containing protein [Anaerolineales bacterium]|nr:serine hydrolase domain-containing protein [Anaerolineales bacterium]
MHKWELTMHNFLLVLTIILMSCSTPAEVALVSNPASEIDAYLNARADRDAFSGSVLIAQDGEILLSKGYGFADREQKIPNDPQTRFRIGSVTKQFTAMAILILQIQGKLNVQDRICAYLSECPAAWEEITIHHLLTHTSGIPNFTNFADYRKTRATPSPPEETIHRFENKPLDFQPGERWNYSNSGYILLGLIIEQAASQSYETFLQKNIFTPLKMTSSGYDHNRNDLAVGYKDRSHKADFADMSIPFAAGGLYSTVEDMYQWDQALYREQLVPQAVLDEMFAPHAAIPKSFSMVTGSSESAYGYGWMIGKEDNRRIIEHGGGIEGFASIITRYPDNHTTIIILSNQQNNRVDSIRAEITKRLFRDD